MASGGTSSNGGQVYRRTIRPSCSRLPWPFGGLGTGDSAGLSADLINLLLLQKGGSGIVAFKHILKFTIKKHDQGYRIAGS